MASVRPVGQPLDLYAEPLSEAFTQGLVHLVLPENTGAAFDAAGGPVASDTSTLVGGQFGRARRFARGSSQILTLNSQRRFSGYSRVSGFMYLRMDNLSNASADTFISCRTVGNAGFVFGIGNATPAGSFPDRTFRLGLVVSGVAAYTSTVTITGLDSRWGSLGFSANSSGTVRFFANGQFLDAVAVGAFSNPGTQNVTIGAQGPTGAANAYLDADVLTAAVWSGRYLSDAEHATLHANPLATLDEARIWVPVSAAGGGTVALTGQSATASIGAIGSAITVAETGQAVSVSAGTAAPVISIAETGSSVAASAGTLAGSRLVAQLGQAVTASAGVGAPSTTIALAGQAVTASAGTITYNASGNITLALSGQAVTANAGTLPVALTKAATGSAAAASAGAAIPGIGIAASGSAVTGSSGTLALGIAVRPAGSAAAATAGTITYGTAGNVTVSLSGVPVTVSAGAVVFSSSEPLDDPIFSRAAVAQSRRIGGNSLSGAGARVGSGAITKPAAG